VPHFQSMFDREYIGVWDLEGKDRTLVMEKVHAGTLTAQGNRKSKKPIVFFRGAEKGFPLNKTNAKTIAALYGTDTDNWIGKPITIYPTTTTFGSDTVDCIRVRPQIPKRKSEAGMKSQPVDERVRERQQRAAESVGANGPAPQNEDAEPPESGE
jgi:hypothetical protein